MDSIDSICEQFSSVNINNIDEYNELVYYVNFQDTYFENTISALINSKQDIYFENIILALLNTDKRYKRYLNNIFIWNINELNNNDIPENIEKYLSIILPNNIDKERYYQSDLIRIKLELMRKIDSKIFNILQSLN
jgi:hypothetical protein